jgi:hypothetical protein
MNEFAKMLSVADEYKSNRAVSNLLSRIIDLKTTITATHQLALSQQPVDFGNIRGLEGCEGYSPFVYNSESHSLSREVTKLVNLKVLTELSLALNSLLISLGADLPEL